MNEHKGSGNHEILFCDLIRFSCTANILLRFQYSTLACPLLHKGSNVYGR